MDIDRTKLDLIEFRQCSKSCAIYQTYGFFGGCVDYLVLVTSGLH